MKITVGPGVKVLCSVTTVQSLIYKQYHVAIETAEEMADSEFACILKWVFATTIVITDKHDHDVGSQLSKRPRALSEMAALQRLSFEVSPTTFDQLKMHNFMEKLPAILVIGVNYILLDESQITQFQSHQENLLEGWICNRLKDIRVIAYANPTAGNWEALVRSNFGKSIMQQIVDFGRYIWDLCIGL